MSPLFLKSISPFPSPKSRGTSRLTHQEELTASHWTHWLFAQEHLTSLRLGGRFPVGIWFELVPGLVVLARLILCVIILLHI